MITSEDKEGLIDLIEWYRDEYHKIDEGHSKMISEIREISDEKLFGLYEKIVDGWLD